MVLKVNFKNLVARVKARAKLFLNRRPHRSFRRTRRRDYVRSLKLPGYVSFASTVLRALHSHRRIFTGLVIWHALLTIVLVGIASQDVFLQLGDLLTETGQEVFEGNLGKVGEASILLIATISGGSASSAPEAQQAYAGIITLYFWLVVVWLLRNLLAGNKIKLRDGLYNAGAPILPMILMFGILIIQLLPAALAAIAFGAAQGAGMLTAGVEGMLFSIGLVLLVVLSLYWAISTVVALVIVTLPGMYPLNAFRVAGDLVVGRRLRLLMRVLWLIVPVGLFWLLTAVPVILFNRWLIGAWPEVEWLPLVPLTVLILSSVTLIFTASYIYMLYRKVVEDDVEST